MPPASLRTVAGATPWMVVAVTHLAYCPAVGVPLLLTLPPVAGAAQVPSARRKLLVPPPLAGTSPCATFVNNVPEIVMAPPTEMPLPAEIVTVPVCPLIEDTPPPPPVLVMPSALRAVYGSRAASKSRRNGGTGS